MLSIKLYSNTQDLLAQMPKSGQIICPGPKDADNFRDLINTPSNNGKLEVITMAGFVTGSLRALFPGQEINKKNKFSLMMTLGWSFHKFFPEKSFNEFEYYFNLLTELRGVTLDLELFASTVQGLRAEDFAVIAKLWMTIDALEIVDEQKSYFLIGNLKQEKNLIFFGFNNFSGTQIDFLKNLATQNEVTVYISSGVKGNLLTKSWPQWLAEEDVFSVQESPINKITNNIFLYAKGSLNIAIKQLPEKYKNVLLVQKNPELLKTLEVCAEQTFYKAPLNLFHHSIERIFGQNYLEYKANPLENIRDYKITKLIEDIKKIWKEEIGEIDIADSFVQELFKQMVILNLPRNYISSTVYEELAGTAFGLENIDFIENEKNLLLVFDGQYQFPRMQKTLIPAEWEKPLRALSPINNGEVEYYSTVYKLKSLMSQSENIILIENEVFHDNPFWNELVRNIDKVKAKQIFTAIEKTSVVIELPNAPKKEVKLTASALQSYLECPRKYYFNYIYKIPDLLSDESSLTSSEIGTLSHAGIAYCYENPNDLIGNLKKIFNEYIQKWKKKIAVNALEKSIVEVAAYVRSGLAVSKQIKDERPNAELKFEVEIAGGRADLIIEESDSIVIIDFKLSESSIPSATSFRNLDQIQLLHYGSAFDSSKKITSLGYVCLKETEKSSFFGEAPLYSGSKNTNLNLAEILNEYQALKENLIEKLKSDNRFLPEPRSNKDCDYCPVAIICDRGVR